MKQFVFIDPHNIGKKKWELLSRDEQDRAVLSWLIVIKLSDAPIARLERALRQLQ